MWASAIEAGGWQLKQSEADPLSVLRNEETCVLCMNTTVTSIAQEEATTSEPLFSSILFFKCFSTKKQHTPAAAPPFFLFSFFLLLYCSSSLTCCPFFLFSLWKENTSHHHRARSTGKRKERKKEEEEIYDDCSPFSSLLCPSVCLRLRKWRASRRELELKGWTKKRADFSPPLLPGGTDDDVGWAEHWLIF